MDRKLNSKTSKIEIQVGKALSDLINPNKKNLIIPKIKNLREILKKYFIELPPVKLTDEINIKDYNVQILIEGKLKYSTSIDENLDDCEIADFIIDKLKCLYTENH